MLKQLVIEEPPRSGISLPVWIVSADRPMFLRVVEKLSSHPWRGRLLYYEGSAYGGVDIQVQCRQAESGTAVNRCSMQSSSPTAYSWGIVSDEMEGSEILKCVRELFLKYPCRAYAGPGAVDEAGAVPVRRFQSPPPAQPRPSVGQLSFL